MRVKSSREVASGEEGFAASIVEHGQGAYMPPTHAAAERGPIRAIPMGYLVRRQAASCRETFPGIESCSN